MSGIRKTEGAAGPSDAVSASERDRLVRLLELMPPRHRWAFEHRHTPLLCTLGVLDPPTTEAELTAAVEAFRPELAATEHAREAVSFLVWHPPLPWAARPGYGALVAAAIGLMPVWTRRPLRLPWFPVSERTVVRALGSAATGTIRWALRPPPPSDPQDAAPAATSASPSAVRQ